MLPIFPRTDFAGAFRPAVMALALGILAASSASAQPDPFGPFPGRSFRGTRPPRPTVQPGEEARVEEEIEGAVRVAILNLDRSALGALVEAKLRDRKMVNWWPRWATGKLLAEAQLHAGLDLPAAPLDSTAGKPPLPDGIILLRTRFANDTRQAEVIVCEPGLGLRLGAQRVTLSGEPVKDVEALADAATSGLKKLGETMRQLWAVPPFRSADLTTTDDLRSSLAHEAEHALLAAKGSFVVELEHIPILTAARTIAGIDPAVRRPTPRFVLGEYRHEKAANSQSLALSVTVQESEAPGQVQQLSPAAKEDATQRLRSHISELAKPAADNPLSRDDGTAEKNLIAAASRLYQREGNWGAALALTEMRLLIEPGSHKSRADAVSLGLKLLREQADVARRQRQTPEVSLPVPPLSTRPAAPPSFSADYVQAMMQALNNYRRIVTHIEWLLANPPPADASGRAAPLPSSISEVSYALNNLAPPPEQLPALAAVYQQLRRQRQELSLRLLERAAARGEPGDMSVLAEQSTQERHDLVLRMLVEFAHYPRPDIRNSTYISAALNYGNDKEGAEKLLSQLATLTDPNVQKAVEQHRQRRAQIAAASQRPATAGSTPMAAVPRPEPTPAKSDSDAQVSFKPLSLPWKSVVEAGPDADAACELFLPLGKAGDLFCHRGQILLARKKGEYKLIWEGPTNLMFKHMTSAGYGASLACFDGKYAWVPLVDPGKPARLLVIDPATEKVSELTAKEGLPADPAATSHPQLAATALAPGKAFLAGSFGRAYLAVATFDPEKASAVKVIHEARDLPVAGERDQHLSPTLAFDPVWLFTLSGKSDDGKPMQRVLVGRYANSTFAAPFPLIVDPESGKVEVLTTPLAQSSEIRPVASGGQIVWTLPWQVNAAGGQEIWRLSLPELKPQSVGKLPLAERSQYASVAIEEGRVHLLTQQWHTAGSWGESLTSLAGKIPGQQHEWRLPIKSELHGWLLVNPVQSRLHAVEFRE
jgi:hypothetical protein